MRGVLHRFGVREVLFVSLEDGRTVDHRVKRGPFLEVDVDKLIRNQPRRRFDRLVSTNMANGGWGLGEGLC